MHRGEGFTEAEGEKIIKLIEERIKNIKKSNWEKAIVLIAALSLIVSIASIYLSVDSQTKFYQLQSRPIAEFSNVAIAPQPVASNTLLGFEVDVLHTKTGIPAFWYQKVGNYNQSNTGQLTCPGDFFNKTIVFMCNRVSESNTNASCFNNDIEPFQPTEKRRSFLYPVFAEYYEFQKSMKALNMTACQATEILQLCMYNKNNANENYGCQDNYVSIQYKG